MQLPEEFTRTTREVMGAARFERYLQSFEEDTPVSIRLNPRKSERLKKMYKARKWKMESGKWREDRLVS